jgi:hypothetical protein
MFIRRSLTCGYENWAFQAVALISVVPLGVGFSLACGPNTL